MFVRHALPGERVLARLTGGPRRTALVWRADAVEVLRAVAGPRRAALPVRRPRRRAAAATGARDPAGAARPEGRGGRASSSAAGGLSSRGPGELPPVDVEVARRSTPAAAAATRGERPRLAHPGRFAVDAAGRPGLRRHRSHDVVPVDDCPIADPRVDALGVGRARWRGAASIDVAAPAEGDPLVVVAPAKVRPPRLAASASVAVRDEPRRPRGDRGADPRARPDLGVRDVLVDGVRR